jgi:hypothetical protein
MVFFCFYKICRNNIFFKNNKIALLLLLLAFLVAYLSIEDAPVNEVEHWWWRDKLKNLRYNSIAEIKQKRGGGELLLLENVFWVYIVVFL